MIDFRMLVRIVGVLALALSVAQCGDGGGGNDNDNDDGSPPPGTFTGTTADGGSITLQVGSIEAVSFTCDELTIQETFSPPQPIDDDGRFAVQFDDGGRTFEVRGTFTTDNAVSGTIDDEDDECDTSFTAARGGVTPTAVITRTPSGGNTLSPTATPTITSTGPTSTDGTPTLTPTPTITPTNGNPGVCPQGIEVIGTAGAQRVLDTGWTGLAHNQSVIQDGKLTFSLSNCVAGTPSCGQCTLGGPVQNIAADQGDIDAHRCSNDTSKKCDDDTGCTSPGKCVFYFGAPLPLSAGGVSTCVTNQISGSVSGTTNLTTGAFDSTLNLTSRVFNPIETALPCPTCVGDGAVNDGTAGGTCSGGARNGQACDGNGRSPVPSFGTTSLDCPPNPGAFITALSIALSGSSGTETRTLSASDPDCSDAAGKKCFCPSDSQVTRPNACIDDTSIAGDGTLCEADSATEGHCTEGPNDSNCQIESFRGCLGNQDCPAAGDSCGSGPRPCYLDNGIVGQGVSAIGMADPPSGGEADPTFAALFCVGKTNAAVNAAAGLPGLGRIELPLHTKQIATLPAN